MCASKKNLILIVTLVIMIVFASAAPVYAAPKPKTIKLNKTGASVLAGKTITLKATVKPERASQKLKWSSGNKSIASVTAKGVVKGVKPGKTTVAVRTINAKKASCAITVIKPGPTSLEKQIAKTKTAKKTSQIIVADSTKLYLLNKQKDGTWKTKIETQARHGRNGFASPSVKYEGDGKTPTGSYPLLFSFGFDKPEKANSKSEYRRITKNSYWVSDSDSEYYNQWYEGDGQKGEHLIDYNPVYKYVFAIGYNTEQTPKKGSAIFLHCFGKGNTAGCISVGEAVMQKLFGNVKDGAYMIITPNLSGLKAF